MHELSVVQALLREIDAIAVANGASTVRRVTVQIGPLSGVDPGLLARAFESARGGGRIARAELIFESLTVTVRCRECGGESVVAPNRLLCGACGGYRTTLITGDELLLRSVELEPREPDTAARH
ncbi:MAG: hydrogenase maturation nickel metallochaperone HypA [Gammaproteobacteria bacterium]